MEISSPAFKAGESIPSKYSCDDLDVSPPLIWKNVPEGTESLALICDDPDAPSGTFVHWVLYNLPPDAGSFEENVPKKDKLGNGALQGKNDFGRLGYGGPCPPSGTHRYYFKLYALDSMLEEKQGMTKKELLKAMETHVLEEIQLMGRYKRKP